MRIYETHSINGGLEAARAKGHMDVIEAALADIDLGALKKKVSREKTKKGAKLWSPVAINKAFRTSMNGAGWHRYTRNYFICLDYETNGRAARLPYRQQEQFIRDAGFEPLRSNTESDFLRDGTVVEMQLGKYPFVSYDIFQKNSALRKLKEADCAVEIVVMKSVQRKMSSGVAFYQQVTAGLSAMCEDDLPNLPTAIIGIR